MPDAAPRHFCQPRHFWQLRPQRWLSTVLPALMLPAGGFAAELDRLVDTNPLAPSTWLTISPEVTNASFRWNIAGDAGGGNPNVFSEYKWQSLQIIGLRGEFGHVTDAGWTWRLAGSYGRIISGNNEQAEYLGDNRTQQSFLAKGRSDDGQSAELEVAVGRHFYDEDSAVTPEIGLMTSHQRLLIYDSYQLLPTASPIEDLHSNYRSHWTGLIVGAKARWQMVENLAFDADARGLIGVYQSAGDLDKRVDLAHPNSFSQHAQFIGWRLHGQVSMLWSDGVEVACGGGAEARYLGPGSDRLHYAEGGGYDSHFNGGRWQAYTLDLTLRYFW